MSVKNLILPDTYLNKLDILETEVAIKLVKDTFERELASALSLTRVSAPLFVRPETGLNDDLNGVERPAPLWLCAGNWALYRHERHPAG